MVLFDEIRLTSPRDGSKSFVCLVYICLSSNGDEWRRRTEFAGGGLGLAEKVVMGEEDAFKEGFFCNFVIIYNSFLPSIRSLSNYRDHLFE